MYRGCKKIDTSRKPAKRDERAVWGPQRAYLRVVLLLAARVRGEDCKAKAKDFGMKHILIFISENPLAFLGLRAYIAPALF